MKQIATVELTDKEAKTVVQFLRTTPVQGNFDTLPKMLAEVAAILKKIELAFQDEMPPLKEETPVRKRGHAKHT